MEAFFWLCFASMFWCFAGYPLAMRAYARFRSRPAPPPRSVGTPRVTVVLAVRNGAEHLERRLENLLRQSYPGDRLECLVVCNGCTDATHDLAEAAARRDDRVRVLVSPPAEGKAGALNRAVAAAAGEIIVFADVRQQFHPDAIRRLLAPFGDPVVGAVSGRLIIQRSDRAAVEGMRLYWGLETSLRLAESRTGSVVGVTGAIYAVRRECYEPIPPNTILDDVWLPMRIVARGRRVLLAPDALAYDVPSGSQRQEYLRKRRTMVGNLQLVRALPWLLSPWRNPVFARYVSHKLLRLATPLCLLGMMAAAATLPGWFYQAFFLAGAAGFLLGCVGLLVRTPLLSPAAAVVLMHAAIIAAFFRFRQDAAEVWVAQPAVGDARTPSL